MQGTQANAVAPPGLPPGRHDVVATNPDGASSTLPGAYMVIDAVRQDLAVSNADLWFDALPVRQDRSTLVGVNVHRSGGNQPLLDVEVAFYLDAVTPASLLGMATLPPLEPGVDVIDSASVSWAPTTPGQHTIIAVVDPAERVEEASETNNIAQWAVDVLPPASTGDTTPPAVNQLTIAGAVQWTTAPTVTLELTAQDNVGVASMYLVERIYNHAARQWTAVQQSGWLAFDSPHTLTFSPVGGARYIQAWVADAAGNVSPFSQRALINYLAEQDTLLEGQVHLYRVYLQAGESLTALVTPLSGDPDLYIWNEAGTLVGYGNAFDLNPDRAFFTAGAAGFYQIEVHGYRDSIYHLSLDAGMTTASATTADAKALPTAPSVAPDSAPPEQQALPDAPQPPGTGGWRVYMPITVK